MIVISQDEEILESYNFNEWPLKLRTGQIILTNKSFYALEGTWGIKTSIQCRYEEIIHIEYKESFDYNYLILGAFALLFYFLIVTIPLGIAFIHMGLQKQLKIGLEFYGFKTIHGPSNVLLRVLRQIKMKSKVSNTSIEREKYDSLSDKQQRSISSFSPKNSQTQITKSSDEMLAPPFYCQICALKHPAGTKRMLCEECGRSICIDSFADMAKAGRTMCPLCDGKLSAL